MTRPSGTQHTCPEGTELIAKSIDPSSPPSLEAGQVLLIKAGPEHFTGSYPGTKDISHYDVCQGDVPPVTVPPVTVVTVPPTPPEVPELAMTGWDDAGLLTIVGLVAVLVGVALARWGRRNDE